VIKKYIIILLIIFLYISISLSAYTQENIINEIMEKYKTGIFHIGQLIGSDENSDIEWLGSAFLLDDTCTFATAKHVFKNANKENLVVRFRHPDDNTTVLTLPIRILYEDSKSDLAFLKIDTVNNQPCKSKINYSFNISSEYVMRSLTGETVFIIGYPILSKIKDDIDIPVVRKGIVSSTEIKFDSQPMILLDLIGVPGFSGSPVILESTGEVIGIIYGPGPTERIFGFEWATPITQKEYFSAINASSVSADENSKQK